MAPVSPSISITVAGQVIPDAAKSIIDYLEAPRERFTLLRFDYEAKRGREAFASGAAPRITQSSIDASNALVAGFRRTYPGSPLAWFEAVDSTAPWNL